jgi:hypothetical protein
MQIIADKIRLLLDQATNNPPQDVITSSSPTFWNGTDVRFEIALALNDLVVTDISNWDSITLLVKDQNSRSGIALMSKTLSSTDIDSTLTDATWADGTKQHIAFDFDHTETVLPIDSSNQTAFWMVITGVFNQTIGGVVQAQNIVLAAGNITVKNGGNAITTPVSVTTPTYRTATESDARYQATFDLTDLTRIANAAVRRTGDIMTGALTCPNFNAASGGGYFSVGGVQVVTTRQLAIASMGTPVAASGTPLAASQADMLALAGKFNVLLAELRTHGLIAT